jgi:hypothetical protein
MPAHPLLNPPTDIFTRQLTVRLTRLRQSEPSAMSEPSAILGRFRQRGNFSNPERILGATSDDDDPVLAEALANPAGSTQRRGDLLDHV